MTENDELVKVVDLTFLFPVPGVNGEPAKVTYTVREHAGDVIKEQPGVVAIHYAPRDLPSGQRLPGRKVTLSSAQILGMERDVRLEKRVRPSILGLVKPIEELKQKLGVDTPSA